MRTGLLVALKVFVAFVVLSAPAGRRDGVACAEDAPPRTPSEAVARVVAAVEAGDNAKLTSLAALARPDPWLVADELCFLGAKDTAKKYAALTTGTDKVDLCSYVAAWTARPDEAKARAALAAANAHLARRDVAGILAAVEKFAGDARTVTGIRLTYVRATAVTGQRLNLVQTTALAAAKAAEDLGWLKRTAQALYIAGYVAHVARDFSAAATHFRASAAVEARRGFRGEQASQLINAGLALQSGGRLDEALAVWQEAEAHAVAAGDQGKAATAAMNRGTVLMARGRTAEAYQVFGRAREAAKAAGNMDIVTRSLSNLSTLAHQRGQPGEALALAREAHGLAVRLGLTPLAMRMRMSEGMLLSELGQSVEARPALEEALAWAKKSRDFELTYRALTGLAEMASRADDRPRMLVLREAAVGAATESRLVSLMAEARLSLAQAYQTLGRAEESSRLLREVIAQADRHGLALTRASARVILARALWLEGSGEEAARLCEEAVTICRAGEMTHLLAGALSVGGRSRYSMGQREEGIARMREALALYDTGAISGPRQISILLGLSVQVRALGRLDEALVLTQRALALAEASGSSFYLEGVYEHLAVLRYMRGEYAASLEAAAQAVVLLEVLVQGFSDTTAASTRSVHAVAHEFGALAAVQLGDEVALARFLEGGRATALMTALGGRAALDAAVPEAERRALAQARAEEARAVNALRRAIDTRRRAKASAARKVLEAAQAEVRRTVERLQRAAQAGAALAYPRIRTLAELQAALEPTDALVMFGVYPEIAVALVVTRSKARIVELGASSTLNDVTEAALDVAADSSDEDPAQALAALGARVIKPLGMPKAIKRVLISPSGSLSHAPFSALLPRREVVYVPSGSTWLLLRERAPSKGSAVLALGNPNYRAKPTAASSRAGAGFNLPPLPATADEAKAVGDVVLLAGDATEARLRSELARQPAWAALHLACHGLLRPSDPRFSALALTPSGEDDGFLTGHEVFSLRLDAELAVLSACETARGRGYAGEGVMGFARSFMNAGARRVLCSLWRVDDEATQALMTKFYALWLPKSAPGAPRMQGRSAGAALRAAQDHVRTFERVVEDVEASRAAGRRVTKKQRPWQHPRYWAAWVLWGLPD